VTPDLVAAVVARVFLAHGREVPKGALGVWSAIFDDLDDGPDVLPAVVALLRSTTFLPSAGEVHAAVVAWRRRAAVSAEVGRVRVLVEGGRMLPALPAGRVEETRAVLDDLAERRPAVVHELGTLGAGEVGTLVRLDTCRSCGRPTKYRDRLCYRCRPSDLDPHPEESA
jgi:hypothetical protein